MRGNWKKFSHHEGMAIEIFSIKSLACGDWKVFCCHSHMATKFNHHSMTLIEFSRHQIAVMYFGRYKWIYWLFWSPFRNHQMATKFVATIWWWSILEEVFSRYMSFKMQPMIHFWAPLFSFGYCVFGCPLITIAWNLGWVEVTKSLVKGYLFHILWIFWITLNLEFFKV
jgi:hypothetical protein